MGEDANDIKMKIAKTKDAIADTVGQLTSTAAESVAQTQDRVADVAQGTQTKIGEALDAAGVRVRAMQDVAREKLPLADNVRQANPMLVLLGVAAVAFAAGYLIPLSAFEKQRLSPIGEALGRRAEEARDEVVSQGTAVVNETITAAKTSLKKHGDETAAFLGVSDSAPSDAAV